MAVRSLKNSTLENFANYSSSMNAGYDFNDFELIESVFVASNTASVTFSNLNQYATEYKHLQLRLVGRPAGSNVNFFMQFNNDTGSNYTFHELYVYSSGGSVTSGAGASQTSMKAIYSDSSVSTSYGVGVMDILDAYSTTKNKTIRGLVGALQVQFIALRSGLWQNTSPISSIYLFCDGGHSIAAGSRFSLYGVR